MSHTYALLDVPATVYTAIRALLMAAEYQHALHTDDGHEVIDMHGIALRARTTPHDGSIEIGSLLSQSTKEGRVEIAIDGAFAQLSLDKAREVLGMLHGAVEAAVTDQILFQFLTTKVGLDPERASRALVDFRELRQGSRDVVRPQ